MCLPGIDGVVDYDSPYRDLYVPDIDAQYVVEYQDNGEIYQETFTVFEDEDDKLYFAKALEFAKTHDTILFYQEIGHEFFNPKTGEAVETPVDAAYCRHYYDQPIMPYRWLSTPIETDQLPF